VPYLRDGISGWVGGMTKLTPRQQLDNLEAALVEDIMGLSDEELKENGEDQEGYAKITAKAEQTVSDNERGFIEQALDYIAQIGAVPTMSADEVLKLTREIG
jgi:hypothetical protein